MSKYDNKYRIESARLKDWDYSKPWWYFVTINTKNHYQYFGKVERGIMILNEMGRIVEQEWLVTKEIRKNVDLDYYVIMPNHLHGIIIINGPEVVETNRVRLYDDKEIMPNGDAFDASIRTVKNCLSDIIRGFKSAVTKKIHDLGNTSFAWQPRFYDRIIRNPKELYIIQNYIQQNPLKWEFDKNSFENIYDM